jgi:hypothetical protein
MRRLPSLLAVTAVAALLAACVRLPVPLATEAVGRSYHAGGGHWGDGGAVVILLRTLEQDGRVAFCGAWSAHSNSTRTLFLNDYVANVAVLRLAGDRIQSGLGILPEARYRDDMTGATARCYLTERPWRAIYAGAEPEIRIARLQFHEGEGSGRGGGDTVVFRQAPVHRPLPPPDIALPAG